MRQNKANDDRKGYQGETARHLIEQRPEGRGLCDESAGGGQGRSDRSNIERLAKRMAVEQYGDYE